MREFGALLLFVFISIQIAVAQRNELAVTIGGNVRVGLEDNFYVEEGRMAKSNGDLVEKAARLAHDLGRDVATIDEARTILCLSKR